MLRPVVASPRGGPEGRLAGVSRRVVRLDLVLGIPSPAIDRSAVLSRSVVLLPGVLSLGVGRTPARVGPPDAARRAGPEPQIPSPSAHVVRQERCAGTQGGQDVRQCRRMRLSFLELVLAIRRLHRYPNPSRQTRRPRLRCQSSHPSLNATRPTSRRPYQTQLAGAPNSQVALPRRSPPRPARSIMPRARTAGSRWRPIRRCRVQYVGSEDPRDGTEPRTDDTGSTATDRAMQGAPSGASGPAMRHLDAQYSRLHGRRRHPTGPVQRHGHPRAYEGSGNGHP